ncbi:hypothetical protein, partial [Stomatobaculum longum]
DKRASATGIAAGRKAGWRRREEKPRLGARVLTGERVDKRAVCGRCSGRRKGSRRWREEKPRLGAWVLTGERVDKRASATGVAAGGKGRMGRHARVFSG